MFLSLFFVSIIFCVPLESQLVDKAEKFLHGMQEQTSEAIANVTAGDSEKSHEDSLRIKELTLQIEEMRQSEMRLRAELTEAGNRNAIADSLKRVAQLSKIDSLRSVTPGVPVVIDNDTLFHIYTSRGGFTAADRAESVRDALEKIGTSRRLTNDSVYMLDNDHFVDIMYGHKVIISITEEDGLWYGTTPQELAGVLKPIIADKIKLMRAENSLWQLLKRIMLFLLVILVQYLLVRLINYVFRKIKRALVQFKEQKLKPVVVKDYEILNKERLTHIVVMLCNFLRYIILILLFLITIPILFSIFPQTEHLGQNIFHYILDPVKMVVKSVVEYIPNLFIILIIWYCIRYIIKGLRYLSHEIQTEKLKISGFYPDWAEPTFNIIRFLLYAFMIAMIYPYLPGSESGVFQGISVFVGLIVSLGSSSVISNFIAGFVITYMRPFKRGDFIKVNDTVGNVIEKSPFVTRIRTIKNEVVTIPNSFITTSNTVNYSASARKYGLIIHTMLTMGYDVPWRKVHQLLINAALDTNGILPHPTPFVLETELNDNYMCYQINAYIENPDDMPVVMSDLLENIQDRFNEAGIDLFAPHHFTARKWRGDVS